MPDSILVGRAQNGDRAAFEALYRAHRGRVHTLCLRMVGNRSLAEDLTQEAFVRAWQKLGSFGGRSAFSTWLHRLTVNVVLGRARLLSRSGESSVATDELQPAPATSAPVEPGHRIDLERAIGRLPSQARIVFVLHDVEGWSHVEIAERLGIATGTSKAHLHRARRVLRETLTS